jgi:hypothetical protein
MAVGDGGPAPQAGHLGRGAGLIDEDELLGIEIGFQAWRRTATSGRSCSAAYAVFFKLIPRRSKKYHTVAGQDDTDCFSARCPAISARLMSGRSLTSARMKASWASSFDPLG